MSHTNDTHDSTVQPNGHGDTGSVYVPAQVQRDLGICIGTELDVVLSDIPNEFVDQISFTNQQTAGDKVTVPAQAMRQAGLDGGEDVTASFSLAEDDTDDVDDEPDELGELSSSKGALNEDDTENILDDVMSEFENEEDTLVSFTSELDVTVVVEESDIIEDTSENVSDVVFFDDYDAEESEEEPWHSDEDDPGNYGWFYKEKETLGGDEEDEQEEGLGELFA